MNCSWEKHLGKFRLYECLDEYYPNDPPIACIALVKSRQPYSFVCGWGMDANAITKEMAALVYRYVAGGSNVCVNKTFFEIHGYAIQRKCHPIGDGA